MLNHVRFSIWFDSQQGVVIKDVGHGVLLCKFGSVIILQPNCPQRVMSEGKNGRANIL